MKAPESYTISVGFGPGSRMLFRAMRLLLVAAYRLLRVAAGVRRRRRAARRVMPEPECRAIPSCAEVAAHEMRFIGARCARPLGHEGKHRTHRGHEFDGYDPPGEALVMGVQAKRLATIEAELTTARNALNRAIKATLRKGGHKHVIRPHHVSVYLHLSVALDSVQDADEALADVGRTGRP